MKPKRKKRCLYGFRHHTAAQSHRQEGDYPAGELCAFLSKEDLLQWLREEDLTMARGNGGGERVYVTRLQACKMVTKERFQQILDESPYIEEQ